MTSNPRGIASVPLFAHPQPAAPVTAPLRSTTTEFALNDTMRPGEPVTAVFERLGAQLAAREAAVLSVMIFGTLAARAAIDAAMIRALGEIEWPVTWVEGKSCGELPLAGVQVLAVAGRTVTRVRLGRLIVGSVYDDGESKHCFLGGVGPTTTETRAPAQVQQMFGNLEWALDVAGFELRDVVRTWFYNDDILGWYDEFNRVRSAHYRTVAWRTGSLPASTGIGARNPAGAALTVAAWAVRPHDGVSRAQEIGSPLQCPAPSYGSAFSRAMEVNSGGARRLTISGTASIHPGGQTAWVGNPKKQVDLTMEVVGAILQSRGLDFGDVTRGTAYCEHPLFQPYFAAWCAARDLERMPVVSTHAVVCRRDLLFEIEVDAAARAKA